MHKPVRALCATGMFLLSLAAQAAVNVEEAKQLGAALTPWGAEKAGNKEGTIPEWSGQIKVPAGYDAKKPGVRPDPFAGEKPLFSINAQNMDKYADKLSEGVKAMMKQYPAFRIDVYPTHRTVAYPQYVINNTLKNATSCKAANNGLRLEGCHGSVPFPLPKNGNEVMWNHTARYTAHSWYGNFVSALVDASGKMTVQGVNQGFQEHPFNDPKNSGAIDPDSVYWRIRYDTTDPARMSGNKVLLEDTLANTRRAWAYIPGQRRVKLTPDLAYDTPAPQSGGAMTIQDTQGFLGAQDRYDFKLVGKKELFIPYNNFKMADGAACPDSKKYLKGYYNPDCMRWELHRVWQVEATLRPQFRNIYAKRTFYWDEDYAGAGLAENYDASGNIFRVVTVIFYPMYESQGLNADQNACLDLRTGIYFSSGDVAESGGWYPVARQPSSYFSPEAMAGEGVR